MKKNLITMSLMFVLVFSLQANIFADEGHIPTMGKNCPSGTTCLTQTIPPTAEPTGEQTILKSLLDYLSEIFG